MDGNKNDETIGQRIGKLRTERNESQEALAKAIDEARETIKHWENGTRRIKAEAIIKLSQHFDVTSDYLLGLSDVKSANEDIQTACKITGLSEHGTETLTGLSVQMVPNGKKTLNAILESQHFPDLLADLSTYLWAISYRTRNGNETIDKAVTKDSIDLYREFIAPAMMSRLHDTLEKIKEESGREYIWEKPTS